MKLEAKPQEILDGVLEEYKEMILENIEDVDQKSPIEKMFYIQWKHTYFSLGDEIAKGLNYDEEFSIEPQHVVKTNGKAYRVDFDICIVDFKKLKTIAEIFVELDSKRWHDQSEEQTSYEKVRDRELQPYCDEILHFTGKEVYHDVGRCVDEAWDAIERELKKNKSIRGD